MVTVGIWEEKNMLLVNIRDYIKQGKFPYHLGDQKKRIALTLQVWRKLYELIDYINDDVEEMNMKYHLEGGFSQMPQYARDIDY